MNISRSGDITDIFDPSVEWFNIIPHSSFLLFSFNVDLNIQLCYTSTDHTLDIYYSTYMVALDVIWLSPVDFSFLRLLS